MHAVAVAARSGVLRGGLEAQGFRDWMIACESWNGDLSVFRDVASRYCLLSADDDALVASLVLKGTLLYWLVRAEIDQYAVMSLKSLDGKHVAVILNREHFRFHADVPRRSACVLADVEAHARACGFRVGSIAINVAVKAALEDAGDTAWRAGTDAGDVALTLPPAQPSIFTCSSNNLYGSSQLLCAYCGLTEYLPIAGRLQHGWEPGPGIVIEAMRESAFDRYYVWSRLAGKRLGLARVNKEGKLRTDTREIEQPERIALVPIGAPYLYLPEAVDVGPVREDWLLAVPGHSTASCHALRLHDYLAALKAFADARRCSRVTVLLYAEDDREENRAAVKEFGMTPATCGHVGNPGYMGLVRDFIRQHGAVTSDRICTAGMYALYENRPFYIVGAGAIKNDVYDAYDDLVCDPGWIAPRYPGIAAGGLEGRSEALAELGEKLSPEHLKRLLWYWIWDGAS